MKRPLHIIYIPGIGDSNPEGQRKAVRTWRWWGVESELFQMVWADKEPWQPKFSRLLARIDELHAQNKAVALVGASAGASAVINAFAARKDRLVGIVSISGKIHRPEAIGSSYRKNDPAFVESAYACTQSLTELDEADRRRIMSRYAIFDETVLTRDSKLQGAHNRTVISIGHVPTIALQITFAAPHWIRFLKKQAKAATR